ncbi:unnamed protein product [Closterium sp. NIES-54]
MLVPSNDRIGKFKITSYTSKQLMVVVGFSAFRKVTPADAFKYLPEGSNITTLASTKAGKPMTIQKLANNKKGQVVLQGKKGSIMTVTTLNFYVKPGKLVIHTTDWRLGGGSRRVASSASIPEATISSSPASLLRQSPVGPLLLPLRFSCGASYSCSPEATISEERREDQGPEGHSLVGTTAPKVVAAANAAATAAIAAAAAAAATTAAAAAAPAGPSAAAPASPSSVSALTAAVADFASTRRLDFATRVAAAPPARPLSAGDPDALDIASPRTYRKAVLREWASQWKVAMDSELASWRSTGIYVSVVPPPRANVVDGMWLFKVKRPPRPPPVIKARFVARGFSQHEGVDFFQTFAPTLKMTTLWVLLHIAALRDYKLHSVDFSTAFLLGCLNEEIWLRRPPGFTDTFPPGIQWSLRRTVYGLRQSPREWHDTLRSTLRDLGFRPSSADPLLIVRAGSTPFFILVYVDDLVFATTNRAALAESHMVQQVLRQFEFQFSTTQPTPLVVDHRLTGPFPNEPFESSGPYAKLVGCLMYLMTCTRPDLVFPLNVLSCFVATGRHRPIHWIAAVRVAKYLATALGIGLVLGGTPPVELTGHCDSSYTDDVETQCLTQDYCFSLGAGAVSWRSTRSSSVASSSAKAKIYTGAIAALELRWLTFLPAKLGERPRSAPT